MPEGNSWHVMFLPVGSTKSSQEIMVGFGLSREVLSQGKDHLWSLKTLLPLLIILMLDHFSG